MKRILAFLIIATPLLASPDNPTRDELLQTVHHIQVLAQQLQADLQSEKELTKTVGTALDNATKENETLQAQVNTLTAKANAAIRDHDKIMKKYHFLKNIAAIIAGAVAVLLVLQFGALIPPPFNIYAMIAAGGGAGAAVWIFL